MMVRFIKIGVVGGNANAIVGVRLARTFQVGTGKRPSDTPEGPFDDLLTAVFNAIAPDRETKPSRKVIREALSTGRRS